MWFLITHLFLATWVLIDALKRKANVILWVIGTVSLGFIILPVYISKRPLLEGETGEVHRFIKNLSVFWTVLLVIVCIWSQRQNTNCYVQNELLEYKLAAINVGNKIKKDDPVVTQFSSLLDKLSNSCVEDKEQIANISIVAHKRIKEIGINESLLNIMDDLNNVMYLNVKDKSYADYIRDYIVLRKEGLSHAEAIDTLRVRTRGF